MHLAMLALGVGPGDEVIVPAFSHVVPANCVLHVGATPVFVDCDPGSLNMNPSHVQARISDRTKAIIGTEVFGNPSGMPNLAKLAKQFEVPLIEDCLQGLGGRVDNEQVGGIGRVSVFSFRPNMVVTAAEGGMIVTDDQRLAEACRSMRNQGLMSNPLDEVNSSLAADVASTRLGFSYRMSELSAALGISQFARLGELMEARQRVAEQYTRRLLENPDVMLPTVAPDTFMSWSVFVVRLSDRFTEHDRDSILEGLQRHEVGAASYFPSAPLQPQFRRQFGYQPGDFPVADSVSHRTLALPFFPRLTDREIDLVCQTLQLMISRITFARS